MSGVSIVSFAVVACVAIGGFWVLFRESRRGRGPGLFLLPALPLALLFLIAPVPIVAVQSIQAFDTLAASGRSDLSAAGVVVFGLARPLWPGCLGCLVVLCVAALLQARAERRETPPVRSISAVGDAQASAAAPPSWGNWVLVASALLAIPVLLLHYLTSGIAPLIVDAGRAIRAGNTGPQTTLAGMAMSEASATISVRLVTAMLVGFPLTFLVLVFGIFNLLAIRYTRPSAALEKFSWAVVALVAIAATWNLIALTIGMRSF